MKKKQKMKIFHIIIRKTINMPFSSSHLLPTSTAQLEKTSTPANQKVARISSPWTVGTAPYTKENSGTLEPHKF
jgi:hypothetical protein